MGHQLQPPTRERLAAIAPRLARAVRAEDAEAVRGISVCYDRGYHFYGAGPCRERLRYAIADRDRWDREHGRA